jgi:hypothetical protein
MASVDGHVVVDVSGRSQGWDDRLATLFEDRRCSLADHSVEAGDLGQHHVSQMIGAAQGQLHEHVIGADREKDADDVRGAKRWVTIVCATPGVLGLSVLQ